MHEILLNKEFWGAVTFGLLTTVIKYYNGKTRENNNANHEEMMSKMNELQESQENISKGTRNIIRYRLIMNMGHANLKGYTNSKEYREMVNLYDSYKSLGGNGEVDKYYKDFSNLKIDDSKEE